MKSYSHLLWRRGLAARTGPLLCAAALVVAASARGQDYAMTWFTLAGGGTSSGGDYSFTGTIGQPEAGTMSGGDYTFCGGFWGVAVGGWPRLSIALDPRTDTVVVSWPLSATDFVLDQASTLSGSPPAWKKIPSSQYLTNATQYYITVSKPADSKFYRLRQSNP